MNRVNMLAISMQVSSESDRIWIRIHKDQHGARETRCHILLDKQQIKHWQLYRTSHSLDADIMKTVEIPPKYYNVVNKY